MNNFYKNILFGLSWVPLLLKLPYMINVWKWTPMERKDYLLWLLVPVVAFICEAMRRKLNLELNFEPMRKYVGIVLAFLLCAWFFVGYKINAVGILLGIAIVGVGIDFRFGRKVFMSQMPTFVFAALGCPSLWYWIDYYMRLGILENLPGISIKLFIGIIFLFVWLATSYTKGRYPRIKNIIFYGCVAGAVFFNRMIISSVPSGDGIDISDKIVAQSNWYMREIEPNDSDKRFYNKNKKMTRREYLKDDICLNYLEISVGDVSDMHPMGICLKSAGISILSSEQIYLITNGRKIQVNEMNLELDGKYFIAYSWFSNGEISTGDFRKFRMSGRKGGLWKHWQITIALKNDSSQSIDKAREVFKEFIEKYSLK